MTYREAKEYVDNNIGVIGKYLYEDISFRIIFLLIAPKERPAKERMTVYMESVSGLGNEKTLYNLGWLNVNHDVYIISTDQKIQNESLLYDFLNKQ